MDRVPPPGGPYPGHGSPIENFPFNHLTHRPFEPNVRLNNLSYYDFEDALDVQEPPRWPERQEAVQPGRLPELVHRSGVAQETNVRPSQSNNTGHVQASPPGTANSHVGSPNTVCVSKVLELFPDISHKFVEELCASHNSHESLAKGGLSYIENVIEDILARSSYPKETKGVKRKNPVDEMDDKEPEDSAAPDDKHYLSLAVRTLSREFPHIPANYVQRILADKKKLYHAYVVLATQGNTRGSLAPPYEPLKTPRKPPVKGALSAGIEDGWPIFGHLKRELRTAKAKVEKDAAKSRKQKEHEEAERLNEEEHARAGSLVECQCCYTDTPSNRTVPCEGEELHLFCYSCIRMSAETQIGLMKYEMRCFDTRGCRAGFARTGLREAVGASVMEKLESLQQQDEITRAGLDGLEGCPFCEFKAVCPPVEENREFRCANPECEMISCRLCKEETHIPKTCKEAKREKGVSERHLVEEAMSGALIRSCPRCGVKLIKEFGCNKMQCSKCKGMMCYICRKDISREGYHHFQARPGGCNMHGDPIKEQEEIYQAEKAAIDKIRAERPDFTQEDLRVNHPRDGARARHDPRRPHANLPPLQRQPLPPLTAFGYFHTAPQNTNHDEDARVLWNERRPARRFNPLTSGPGPLGPAPPAANPQNNIDTAPGWAGVGLLRPQPQPQGTPTRIPSAGNPPIRAPAPAPAVHGHNPGPQPNLARPPGLFRDPAPNRRARAHTYTGPPLAPMPTPMPMAMAMPERSQVQLRPWVEVIDLTGAGQQGNGNANRDVGG